MLHKFYAYLKTKPSDMQVGWPKVYSEQKELFEPIQM